MKNIFYTILIMIPFAFIACDVDQTKKGDLPEVDVDVTTEPGTMPEYDIDWVNLDVGTRTKTVMVPDVEIVMEETEIEVPYISANWPKDRYENVGDQTIMVEAEVIENEYELEIEEIYAMNDQLIVVAELEREEKSIGDKVMRVSDQVVINAPDLSVKYYIIGDKPGRAFNDKYIYMSNEKDLEKRLKGAKKIYES